MHILLFTTHLKMISREKEDFEFDHLAPASEGTGGLILPF
jgi:hypothetical protein